MEHEVRTDFAMWLGSLFMLIKGGGNWSLDRKIVLLMQKRVKKEERFYP